MMFKDPKTGEFYEIKMSDPKQLEFATKKGLVYAIMHYLPPEDADEEDIEIPEDIKSFWKQATGLDIGDKEEKG